MNPVFHLCKDIQTSHLTIALVRALDATAGFAGRLDSCISAGAFADVFPYFLARARKIVRGLEVHPELGRILEVLRKQEGGLGRYAAFAANQFIDAV